MDHLVLKGDQAVQSVLNPCWLDWSPVCFAHAMWQHSKWLAPWTSPTPRAGWQACSAPDPPSKSSCRWTPHWMPSSQLWHSQLPAMANNWNCFSCQPPQHLPTSWTCVSHLDFHLNYEGFILLPITVIQLHGPGAQRTARVAVKDWGKESIITSATVILLSVPSKGWQLSLALV